MSELTEPHMPLVDCDCHACAVIERDRLRQALMQIVLRVEALKRPCGMDPESPQAIRNGVYMGIALSARYALAKVKDWPQPPSKVQS